MQSVLARFILLLALNVLPPSAFVSSKILQANDGHLAMPILDYLAETEGTDKGRGYEETLGYGAYTGGPVVLTTLSINEIDRLQTLMLQHPGNVWHSSAVGRYQIVRTTLRRLRKDLHLRGTERFDAALQDRLAQRLLELRGYREWKMGLISDAAFQANLALEWASWINPHTKEGAYRGQRSNASLAKQQAALNAVRTR
ncbi:hypothetical protein QD357_01915 [Rhizobium sp. BR 317]|uniref:hypothetical protein n=1 Tax=Rhizobium sp. BR 317 TaxID=3040015 RepID=UPI0039BFEBA4